MKNWISQKDYDRICELMPIPSVDIVVLSESDEVLLLRRTIMPKKGFWALPGGGIRLGDKPVDTAERVLEGETGIKTNKFLVGPGISHFHTGKQNLSVSMLVRVNQPEVQLSDQHDAFMWAKVGQLPSQMHEESVECIMTMIEQEKKEAFWNGNKRE